MSTDARRVLSAEDYARAVHRGLIPPEKFPSWQELRLELMASTARREQARRKQERRVLARLLLQTRKP